jgi:signal transduction histidine kinase
VIDRRGVTPEPIPPTADLLAIAADLLLGPSVELAGGLAEALGTGGAVCLIHDFDERRRELLLVAAHGLAAGTAPPARTPLGEGVAGWAASHRDVAVVADRTRDNRGDHLAGLHVPVAGVAVPVPSRHRYVGGVIEVYRPPLWSISDFELRLLNRLATMLGASHDADFVDRQLRADRDHFARSVIAAQEAERKRLSADIHDGISQRLVGLNFHLTAARDALGEDDAFAAEQLRCARTLADLAGAEARAAIGGLRPPMLDDLGLADSLASLARTCPGVSMTTDIEDGYDLPEHIQTALYRIAQEALQNVVKHANAERVEVRLFATPGAIVLRVRDDGCGFDRSSPACAGSGLGLPGMRERAELFGGRLTVTSRPGCGTVVEACVPNPT